MRYQTQAIYFTPDGEPLFNKAERIRVKTQGKGYPVNYQAKQIKEAYDILRPTGTYMPLGQVSRQIKRMREQKSNKFVVPTGQTFDLPKEVYRDRRSTRPQRGAYIGRPRPRPRVNINVPPPPR